MFIKKFVISIVILIVLIAGYYLFSPLFIDVEVNDAAPIPSGIEELTPEEREEEQKLMEEANKNPLPPMEEEMPEDMVKMDSEFELMGTAGHPVEGVLKIIETEEGTVLRFENFKTVNGPRLNLYLAKDLRAQEYLDLGPIKGTSGNINYLVPEGVDLSEYRYVMHWCVPFRVLFNYADLES